MAAMARSSPMIIVALLLLLQASGAGAVRDIITTVNTTVSKLPCGCAPEADPVCAPNGALMAPSGCIAACAGETDYSSEFCNPNVPGQSTCPQCEDVFSPVCSTEGAVVASSMCHAECLKLPSAAYSQDWCSADTLASMPATDCMCITLYEPICNMWGAEVATNECQAACQGLPMPSSYAIGPCASMANSAGCDCADEYKPVCNAFGEEVATSKCDAGCKGLAWGSQAALDFCSSLSSGQGCGCEEIYQPVCDAFGNEVATNKCEAVCQGLVWGSVGATDYCASFNNTVPSTVTDSPCECSDRFDPVCDAEGNELAVNKCQANKCLELEKGSYSRGWCFRSDPPANCTCVADGIPVCDLDGIKVASSDCEAECAGLKFASYAAEWCDPDFSSPKWPSSNDDDDLSSTTSKEGDDCGCPDRIKPVCDINGDQVADNTCKAKCAGLKKQRFSKHWCGSSAPEDDEEETVEAMWEEMTKDEERAEMNALVSALTGEECGCAEPETEDPVCDLDGVEVAPSECFAECADLRWGDYAAEWCDPNMESPSWPEENPPWPVTGGDNVGNNVQGDIPGEDCGCADQFKPVCDSAGEYLGLSPCKAKCAGLEEGTYSQDWCPSSNTIVVSAPQEETNVLVTTVTTMDNETEVITWNPTGEATEAMETRLKQTLSGLQKFDSRKALFGRGF